jgi:DNA-binding response OmpR family regulator
MKKILIVEDEQSLNDAYRMILETEGYAVNVAFNGKEALERLKDFTPDLILLDLRMPLMGGIEFLQNYDKSEAGKKAKIVIFSNLDAKDEIDKAYSLGANKYILKAWASPKELIKLVKDTLKGN